MSPNESVASLISGFLIKRLWSWLRNLMSCFSASVFFVVLFILVLYWVSLHHALVQLLLSCGELDHHMLQISFSVFETLDASIGVFSMVGCTLIMLRLQHLFKIVDGSLGEV